MVRPRNSGNVGSAVRVLRNFGFHPPRVVDMYRFSPAEARQMAAGCESIVEQIEFFPDLESALEDRAFVVGTTALKRTKWQLEPMPEAVAVFSANQLKNAAILFGNEQSGLSEEELTRCERLITIPTADYSSMNLSHAIGVTAWELHKRLHLHKNVERRASSVERPEGVERQASTVKGPDLAPRAISEPMFDQMFQALEQITFLHAGQDERVRILLRQMFSRNGLTRRDVQVLRGIWRQISWLAKKK